MALTLYNSMTRQKEPFEPLQPPAVGIYVCGLTVYDHVHLGHARMLVAFDMIVRHLRASGYRVTYVRNITDVDDKIIARANDNGEPIDALTARQIEAMNEDCAALGVLPPDLEPRATESIDAMQALISTLLDKDRAYVGDNGDVYYAVHTFEHYGALSGKNPADLRAGARVDVDEAKRDALDFVLWKRAKPGEPSWPSPWGPGRPGWHIECSAMSESALGGRFDIHGGGMDLKFPHHENEIAQSRGASDAGFAKYWLHNGFVQVDDEKMSKSLGNFFTIRDILARYRPEEVRLFLLSAHYRKPLNYSQDELDQARANLHRFYTALRGIEPGAAPENEPYTARFIAAMDDDFNTPGALAVLFEIAKTLNRARDEGDAAQAAALAALLRGLGDRLGLLQDDPEAYLKGAGPGAAGPDDAQIEAAIRRRAQAKADGDYAEADRIRDELKAAGVILEDRGRETVWRRQ